MISRRKTLGILGGGVILAAGGVGYEVTRKPDKALEPWGRAGASSDPRIAALSYAILAPNPHNRQPWIVDLGTEGEVTLYVDTGKLLPHTDPFSRQIVVGLGCFLETMVLAAAKDGFEVALDVFPDGVDASVLDQRPVAVARFSEGNGAAEPALFDHVLDRRSLKEPYDTERPVANGDLSTLAEAVARGSRVGTTNSPEDVAALRELTAEALRIEFVTPHTYKESVDLFRIGHREVNANPDGLDFTGPQFEMLRLAGLFSREGALDMDGIGFTSGLEMVQTTARTGMAYIWQVTEGNSRAEQIVAGRDWMRLNLAATRLGLGVQPMSQALQEYPEMDRLYQDIHARLAPGGGTVQMLGRLGYGPQVAQSPRWPLEAKVRSS